MNQAEAALMNLRPTLSLRELVYYWAPELGLSPKWLLDRLFEAIGNGMFDAIPSSDGRVQRGVVNIDADTGDCWRIEGAKLSDVFAQAQASGGLVMR